MNFLYYLLFLSSFSLASVVQQTENRENFENDLSAPDVHRPLNEPTISPQAEEENYPHSDLIELIRKNFRQIGEEEVRRRMKEYYKLDPKKFLYLALDANIRFQIMAMYVCSKDPASVYYGKILWSIDIIKKGVWGSIEKGLQVSEFDLRWAVRIFLNIATHFIERNVEKLFKKPFHSLSEWNNCRDIIELYIKLLTNVEKFIFKPGAFPKMSFMHIGYNHLSAKIKKQLFLLENFFVDDNGEINFNEFQKLYNRLQAVPLMVKLDKKAFNTRGYAAPLDWYFSLFSIYSCHFFSPKFSQIKNITPADTKFLCLIIIAKNEKDPYELRQKFCWVIKSLIREATGAITQDIYHDFLPWKILNHHPPNIGDNFLRNYANETFYLEECSKMNKWKIKVYLHLLRLK